MGRVFLAESSAAGGFARRVVLKQVRDPGDEELRSGLLAEARLQAKLVHRNIVPVLDLEEHQGQHFIVLEHVDGIDLRRLMAGTRQLPWRLVVYIGMEIAAALDYAHRRTGPDGAPLGLVHHDVTPANILCSWEGEVRLTDFGIARAGDKQHQGLIGNLSYIAPEHAAGDPVDARGDIYSLGLVLYEALCGTNPFHRTGDDETVEAVRANVFSRLPEEVGPAPLRELIERCLARDPALRPESAARLREALVTIPDRLPDPVLEFGRFLHSKRPRNDVERAALKRLLNAGRALTRRLGLSGPIAIGPAPNDTILDPPSRPRYGIALVLALGAVLIGGWALSRRRDGGTTTAPTTTLKATPPTPTPVAILPTPTPPSTPTTPIVLEPEPIEAPAHAVKRGSLSVNAIPWANIWLDDHSLGHTPRLHVPVPAGKHRVRLRNAKGEERTRTIEIHAAQETKLSVVFADP
jgi:serine/threonine protein kinase